MYTVEYSPLYLRITRGDVSIQFTHETNEVTLEWIHPYTAWTDWQPEGVAHHHLRYALGVLRGRMPSICTVTAYDTTAFLCPTPGGDFLVPLAPFYLAFHGKTWYESCTDATHDLITRSRLDDPAFKSPHPSFRFEWANTSLADLLYPVYDSAATWAGFFQVIQAKWPSHMCGLVYPFIYHITVDLLEAWIGGNRWTIPMKGESLPVEASYQADLSMAPYVVYERTRLSPRMSDIYQWDFAHWICRELKGL